MDSSTISTVVSLGWDSVLKLMGSIVLSLGGGAAIALFIFHFMADRLAERLKGKYQLELDKKFESYKANLDNKKYVTKTKFDAEFDLYRKLSKAYFEMVKCINVMIPQGLSTVPANEELRKKVDEDHYTAAQKAVALPSLYTAVRFWMASRRRPLLTSLTRCTTSNSRARPGMPYAFREGDTAKQMVFSVRLASATTRLVVSGSRCRAAHSAEA